MSADTARTSEAAPDSVAFPEAASRMEEVRGSLPGGSDTGPGPCDVAASGAAGGKEEPPAASDFALSVYRDGERRARDRRTAHGRRADDRAAYDLWRAHLDDLRDRNLQIARLEHENRLLREALARQSAWGALSIFRAFRRSARELAITRN